MLDILLPSQKIMFQKLWHDEKELLVIGRRRLGKTRFAAIFLTLSLLYATGLLTALYPEMQSDKMDALMKRWLKLKRAFNALFLLPGKEQGDRQLAKEIQAGIEQVQEQFPKLAGLNIEYIPSLGLIRIVHKGKTYTWWHRGIEKYSHLKRGDGAEIIVIDEAAEQSNETIMTVLSPMLTDSDGILAAFGTARSNKALQEIKKDYIKSKHKELMVITAEDSIARGEMTREQLDKIIEIRFGGDPEHPLFLQEFMCRDDLPVKGAILMDWKAEVRKPDASMKLVASIDIGIVDAYVVLIFACSPEGIIIVSAHKYYGKLTGDIIKELKEIYDEFPVVKKLYVPHDAFSRRTTTADTDEKIWRNANFADAVVKATRYNDKQEQIRMLSKFMPRVFIAPGLPEWLMVDLRNWSWDEDREDNLVERPKHDDHSHTGDALIYGVCSAMQDRTLFINPVDQEEKSPMQRLIDDDYEHIDPEIKENSPDFWQPGREENLHWKPPSED